MSTGSRFKITITIKNVTGEQTWIATDRPEKFHKIAAKVRGPEWIHWIPEAPPIAGDLQRAYASRSLRGRSLNGGAEVSQHIDLAGLYDLTKPGKYRVTFSCELPIKFGDATCVKLVSNEITFTVLPKQP
jgi:hypothetical protein